MNIDYSQFFRAMQPESVLIEAALAVIVLDLTVMRAKDLRSRLNVASLIGALAVVIAAVESPSTWWRLWRCCCCCCCWRWW